MAVDIDGAIVDGRYCVEAKIQSGFYGATWLAKDSTKQRSNKVCLKTFFYEGYAKKELAILKEMASGKFRHDNLCTVLHVSLEKAPVVSPTGKVLTQANYVVFEYCSGTDLFNFLVTGPFEKLNRVSSFPEPLARHYFTQALLAVAYLHERGVFHRDIKPENCVLDGNFNLKLTDFGTNKIMTVSSDPAQVLRTATRGIGTDSYRAPEVNGVSGYDPSLADVWSLGVTLFFMVGIEEMVAKVQSLDYYTRQLVAPLGILFPFPIHCSKLDCYMNSSLTDQAPSNQQFWQEWDDLYQKFSPELHNLFNRVFHLQPYNRITILELVSHPWISRAHSLRPKEVLRQMQERCPSNVSQSKKPTPKVQKTKALGGVDQASLRTTLSSSKVPDYLSDSELWGYSEVLYKLEETQLTILESTDFQEFIIDTTHCRKILRTIVSEPQVHEHRSVHTAQGSWMVSYLSAVGFLPQSSLLYLPLDRLNLSLLTAAATILDGLEMAVFRSALEIKSSSTEDEDMPADASASGSLALDFSQFASSFGDESLLPSSQPESSLNQPPHPRGILRRFSSDPSMAMDFAAAAALDESSQDSIAWSIQSSQEECPEDFVTATSGDYSESHRLLPLQAAVNTQEARQYKAAGLFCKLSGLLTSYGLYQVVIHEQLVLYCKGSTTSFSARLVLTDSATGAVGLSCWCFTGRDEWLAILSRVRSDMAPNPVT